MEIEYHTQDFSNISTSKEINHDYYELPTLHKLRKNISKESQNPKDILSDYVIQKYSNYEVWR